MISLSVFSELVTTALVLIPFVTGIVQLVKMTFDLKTGRFIPLISVIAGAGTSLALIQLSVTGALVGVAIGLAATGLYEVGKTSIAGR